MAYELPAGTPTVGGRSRRFWLHLGDNFFRHILLFIAPVVLLTAVGVLLSQRSDSEFRSVATLDASSNPLVEDITTSGSEFRFLNPAQATAGLVGEQLRTDTFVTEVAAAAGVDTSIVGLSQIRANIAARPSGTSLVEVSATWGEPNIALALAEATIDTYRDYIQENATQRSEAAGDFFTDRLALAEDAFDTAEQELFDYAATLPPLAAGESHSLIDQLGLDQRNAELQQAGEDVQRQKDAIEAAELQIDQLSSEAGQNFRVVDPPQFPTAPETRLLQIIGVIAVFFFMGIIVGVAALLLTTVFDRTVRFDLDIASVAGSPIVASVAPIKSLRRAPTAARGVLQLPKATSADTDAQDAHLDPDDEHDDLDPDDEHDDLDVDDDHDGDDIDDEHDDLDDEEDDDLDDLAADADLDDDDLDEDDLDLDEDDLDEDDLDEYADSRRR